MPAPSRARVWGALWVVYIVWGSTYLGIEYAIRSMPPLLAMGTRFLAAGAIMLIALAIHHGPRFLHVPRRQILFLAILGALLLGLGLGMVSMAQYNDVPTGMVALLIAALPLWIAIFKVIDGAKSSALSWVGILIGFVGVGILLQPELSKPDNGSHIFWMGMVIFGNLGWAFGTYIAPRLDIPKSVLLVTGYQMFLGGISMSLVGLLVGEDLGDFLDATALSWGGWIFLVLIGSIATYTAYLWLVQNAPVGLIATYAYVNPVVAIILGTIFLDEVLSITLFFGAIVVISGVALVVWVESRASREPSLPTA
ncbi:MAG: EamA family transporter [Candidatus Nanopelagicaceae bacterium]|jgi:drug/metabolite transporter (DMT)-like permease